MRPLVLVLALALAACAHAAPVTGSPPALLVAALAVFRSDPPPGWSYTQTTRADGKSTVEHCDGAKPDFARWSLVEKDGRAPTSDELKEYADNRSRRSRAGTAPKLTEQLILEQTETVSETDERVTYRCPLRPGESRDKTALFLRATLVVRKPAPTIESVELASISEFSPAIGVKIAELHTLMTYAAPTASSPSLPQEVRTRMRGRAFWFKSLDGEMSVTFSDYVDTRKRPPGNSVPATPTH